MKKLILIFTAIISVFTGCVQHEATWQEAYDNGVDYMIAKEYKKAEKSFERAVEFDEKKIDAYAGLYHAYIALGKTDNANLLKDRLLQQYDEFDVNICLSQHETIFYTGLKTIEIEENQYIFRYHFFNQNGEKERTNYYTKGSDGTLRDYDLYSYFTENGLSAVETTRFTADNTPDDLNITYYDKNNKPVKYIRFHSGIKRDVPDETRIYEYDRNGEMSKYKAYRDGELLNITYYNVMTDTDKVINNFFNYGEKTYHLSGKINTTRREIYTDNKMDGYILCYPSLYSDEDGWRIEYSESYLPEGVPGGWVLELYNDFNGHRYIYDSFDAEGNLIYRHAS